MAEKGSVTVTTIKLEQAHADAQVLAESALLGERVVSIVRIALFAMAAFSSVFVAQREFGDVPFNPWRAATVGTYALVTLGLFVILNFLVKKTRPRRVFWFPFGTMLI